MSKIIFVWPPMFSEERYGVIGSAGSYMPPLGIGILASVARNHGYDTRILDCEARQLDHEQSAKEILNFNPDYVGISSTTLGIFSAAKLARKLRGEQKDSKIIIGGPHITAIPQETMNLFPDFDIAVIGEGERTIIELLYALENGSNLEKVDGIVFRENGSLYQTNRRALMQSLDDEVPFPAWDLFPNLTTAYRPPVFSFNRLPAMSIITSRGCPMECTFCDRSVFGKVCRAHSPEYVFNMIKFLKDSYGIKDIMIYDDTFVAFRKLLIGLCERLMESKMDIRWSCNGRVDMVNPRILELMRQAGCWQIAYGIESGYQGMLDLMGKRTDLNTIERAIKWTKEAKIKSKGYFMLGFPSENKETIEKTIEFMLKLDLDDVHISLFTPFPNTEAYYLARDSGMLDDDWSKMSQWNPVFVPGELENGDLERYLKLAVRKFYLRKRIALSYASMIRRPEHVKNILRGLHAFTKLMLHNKQRGKRVNGRGY